MPKRAFHLASQLAAQWASPEVLKKRQLTLLQELVQTSYSQTTAWRCLLQRARVHPDDIKTLQDIERLPVVCKEDLLEFDHDERTNRSVTGAENAERVMTSGSSGAPFEFDVERTYNKWRKAQYLRPYVANGRRPWHRVLRLTALTENDSVARSRRGPFPERKMNCTSDISLQIDELCKRKTTLVQGYPSALRCLAFELLARQIETPYVRTVFTDSELLTPDTRALIEKAFGAPDYHVTTDSVIAEVFNDGRPVLERDGDLVVTVLRSRMTPFIRYNLRDQVRMLEAPCSCGRTFPLMKIVAGRSDDLIIHRDGRREPPMSMTNSMLQCSDIFREYQITQNDIGQFTVLIVPAIPITDATKQRIVDVINSHYPDAAVVVQTVQKLSRTPAAKLKAFVSEVPAMHGSRHGN
jgi:phenylacetate-CoA ligase